MQIVLWFRNLYTELEIPVFKRLWLDYKGAEIQESFASLAKRSENCVLAWCSYNGLDWSKRRYQVYPTMHYSLFSPRPPPQMHTSFLLWIVELEKINQPIDSALNIIHVHPSTLCKQCEWKSVEWPKLDGSLSFHDFWRFSRPENPLKTWNVSKSINIKDYNSFIALQ